MAALDVGAVALGAAFIGAGEWADALPPLMFIIVSAGGTFAYFAKASLRVEGGVLSKTNLLGWTSRVDVDQVARVETRYSPQPALCVIRRDGTRALRVNQRLWDDAQVRALMGALGFDPITGAKQRD
jgi:hypothetical protein